MMTMEELVNASGTPERTIRTYLRAGCIPSPEAGAAGYGDPQLTALLAIARMREEGVRRHDIMRARMAAMSPEALERFAYEADLVEDEPPAPEAVVAPTQVTEVPAATPRQEPAPVVVARKHEEWTRIVLRPGLELHVRSGAGDEVQRLAGEIDARYAEP
jgi:DNA-binding transcriptional MerR regulator